VHRCIKCGAEFGKASEDILRGCPNCGGKFFEYHNETKIEKIKEEPIETIMVRKPGVYEVNLSPLLEKDSIIVSDEEGKYLIDINFLFKKPKKKKH